MRWSVDQSVRDVCCALLDVDGDSSTGSLFKGSWAYLFRRNGRCPPVDIAQNAILLQASIHQNFQDFRLYFDPGVCS